MVRLEDAGDNAITVYLAEQPGELALARVLRFSTQARREIGHLLQDLVPSYCSVTVYYDLLRSDFYTVCSNIRRIVDKLDDELSLLSQSSAQQSDLVVLPVYYGEEVAPDLPRVARQTGLTEEQVVAAHSTQTYRVHALGFRPGFAFLAETPEALRVPRMETPRTRVPAGSVAIAGMQAAVYPSASPGGWNLIGRCPKALFSCRHGKPDVLLNVGDLVRFQPVSRHAFLDEGGCLDE
ncbi:5-oxoprolinase subunit PxpB [Microbulbifer sp. YPW1]|uniref:5-oxoprolinase subunit PxpB n=1 Tax=Microbulbifer sp. YPW1 TaxID=2745199 RepID=UPI002103A37F|nr:5-oxoprolinase subunit PxpB [Microbulbifer sp. YPW1]